MSITGAVAGLLREEALRVYERLQRVPIKRPTRMDGVTFGLYRAVV